MKSIIVVILTFLLALTTNRSDAAVDYFLEIDGIAGESQVAGHVGHIPVHSFGAFLFQRALSNSARAATGDGKIIIRPITITKSVDKASPSLFLACATGQHIKKATLYADYYNAQGESGPVGTFLKITLTGVQIGSVAHDAGARSSTGGLIESVTLNFTKIEFEYRAITDGTLGPPTKVTYNLKTNTSQ